MAGVFADLRVIDLSWGIAGPMTTMMLADNGADVIRIEGPSGGPFAQQAGYRVWNRGKRSARLDLQSSEGRRQFDVLLQSSDIVVDSFSLGTTERLGINHEALSALNPGIISCSISAYGEHAVHRDRPGYDGLVAARTGLLYDQKGRRGTAMEFICGRPGPLPKFEAPEGLVRGADRDGPIFPRTPWPSIGATYLGTLGIAAALRARQVSGQGQRVTTSLLQGALAAVCLNWQRVENPDAPLYWMWPIDSRSIEGLYECSDGKWVHHDAGNPPLWSRSNMGDTGNALLAAIAITAALYHRDRTGEGQAVSTSIVNAGLLHTSYAWIHSDGREPDWGHVDGDQYGLSPYYRLYPCALGEWIFLAAMTDEQRANLRAFLPDAPQDDDPESVAGWLGSYFASAVATEAFKALDDRGVPIEVVDECFCRNLFDDPEAWRLNLVSETSSSNVGRFEDPGLLVNITPAQTIVQGGPCACGEQSRQILLELGYSDSEIDAMADGRAILDGAT